MLLRAFFTSLVSLPPGAQGGFAFKHKNNTLVLNAPEGVKVSDIDGDRVKAEADALEAKRASAVSWPLPFFCVRVIQTSHARACSPSPSLARPLVCILSGEGLQGRGGGARAAAFAIAAR